MMDALRRHWPEYLLEAFGLGLFMLSAAGFGVLLFHPGSPVVARIPDGFVRNGIMGLAMGLTAVLNAYSPWGRRSGGHLNPAVTLAFWRLSKVRREDLAGYIAGQFAGALAGLGLAVVLLRPWIGNPSVNYVVTLPGGPGFAVAFAAELLISFLLMFVILHVSNSARAARLTGAAAGIMVALYITFEQPLSGMSMNPARTVGSAAWANLYTGLWIYFLAPPAGMLLAAQSFLWLRGRAAACAKLDHDLRYRCIFCGHKGGS